MRITGGQARGRHIISPKGMDIRPTSDIVREAIFNIIGQDLSGLSVLDLFAGTGSLGIESLSRGATRAVFIDHSQKAVTLIKKNLSSLGFSPLSRIIKKDLSKGMPLNHELMNQIFDLVFLDPPYGRHHVPLLLKGLLKNILLSPTSLIVAESSKNDNMPYSFGNFTATDTRSYGDTKISVYANEA